MTYRWTLIFLAIMSAAIVVSYVLHSLGLR